MTPHIMQKIATPIQILTLPAALWIRLLRGKDFVTSDTPVYIGKRHDPMLTHREPHGPTSD
jgi:hypothetical protein